VYFSDRYNRGFYVIYAVLIEILCFPVVGMTFKGDTATMVSHCGD